MMALGISVLVHPAHPGILTHKRRGGKRALKAGAFQPEGKTSFDSQILGAKITLLLNTIEMHLRKIGKPIFPLTKQNVKQDKSSFPQSEIDPSKRARFECLGSFRH